MGNLSESRIGGAGFKGWVGLVQEQPISLQKKGVWSLLSVVAGEGRPVPRGTRDALEGWVGRSADSGQALELDPPRPRYGQVE